MPESRRWRRSVVSGIVIVDRFNQGLDVAHACRAKDIAPDDIPAIADQVILQSRDLVGQADRESIVDDQYRRATTLHQGHVDTDRVITRGN